MRRLRALGVRRLVSGLLHTRSGWVPLAGVLVASVAAGYWLVHARRQHSPAPQTASAGFDCGCSDPSDRSAGCPRGQDLLERVPMQFEENQGQTSAEVKYLARCRGYRLFLTPDEVVFSRQGKPAQPRGAQRVSDPTGARDDAGGSASVIRMKWAGGQASPGVSGEEVLPGKVNYIKGSDAKEWRTDIPTYRKVRYENVYPGVDVVFYGVDGRRLEYDLVVKPGADPGAIRLSFSGADKVSLEETGDVSIRAGDSTLTQHVPKAYQEIDGRNVPVSVRYVLEGDSEVRLAVASFEREQTLVIDPTVAYSTYLGGTDAMGGDYATGIVVDTSGSAYVCGDTGSTDFPTAGPPYLGAFQGITDCFVTKFAPNGQTLVYSTYLGGNQSDNCRDLVLDSSGRVYLTGVTQGNFPMAGAPYDNTYDGGGGDAFIAVLSASGAQLVASTYLGALGFDQGIGIAIDGSQGIYVCGRTQSTLFPTSLGAYDTILGGGTDAFVAKLAPNLSQLLYSTFLGGNAGGNSEEALGIAVDGSGNAYVVGSTNDDNFPTTVGVVDPAPRPDNGSGRTDAFVTKLNPSGTGLVFSTFLGGTQNEPFYFAEIRVDSADNVYVAGTTMSGNFPTVGAFQPAFGGQFDGFVAKINPAGTALVYSTFLGGAAEDQIWALALDSAGRAYVTGYTWSPNFPVTVDAVQPAPGGLPDGFVTVLSPGGAALDFSTFYGGANGEDPEGITVDSSGCIYFCGLTYSSDFPTTTPYDNALGGAQDAFVAKICMTAADLEAAIAASPQSLNVGATSTVTVTITNNGPGDASSATATTRFPCDVTILSASGASTIAGDTVTSALGALTNGASVTIQIRIRGRSAGTCTATTEASGPVSDANNANNRASVTITFRGAAGQLTDGGSDCFLCCFIATAAYGSPLENQVNHLRHFRDEALQPSETGRDFVRTYYATSPVMANFIRDKAAARLITRRLLEPLADLTKPNTP